MSDYVTCTPNDQLAEIVADALIEVGLIAAARRDELQYKLASGAARKEDWMHWVETVEAALREEFQIDESPAN